MTSERVLEIFKEITTIPRESGHEEPMTSYLMNWGASHGFACKKDSTGNVLITKEAAPGKENVPALVLQGHQDMVCEKNPGCDHDFTKDPINYIIENGWMVAPQTTLGADDGIGIAASLALLESDIPAGKVECLFTISEETGMDGAEALQSGFFTGKTLINLDSEDEGQLFIGCAGGLNTRVSFKYENEAVKPGFKAVRLIIGGAIGGHSGDDINKERANTVQLMARFLYGETDVQLAEINGGGKSNAIARNCEAVVLCADPESVAKRFAQFGDDVKAEFHVTDSGLFFNACEVDNPSQVIDSDTARRLVISLFTCPHGVQAMSQDIEGLVETSANLASVKMEEANVIKVVTSQRSSTNSAKKMIAAKVRANFEAAGASVEHVLEYPGWKPNVDSHILGVSRDSYVRLFGYEPEIKAIHAGLECGLFLEKFPDLDMISFGPTLRGVHAPGEKMDLESLDKFVAHLEDVVISFAK